MTENMDRKRCENLFMFHALSGSDTTSAFKPCGKKKAWEAMKVVPEIEDIFSECLTTPYERVPMYSEEFKVIEKFVIAMYENKAVYTT